MKLFQSHIDSIKARKEKRGQRVFYSFQSHIDSIKAVEGRFKVLEKDSFNPTLIRLRHSIALSISAPICLFQSHIDSIKADEMITIAYYQSCFNPTLIRLRR